MPDNQAGMWRSLRPWVVAGLIVVLIAGGIVGGVYWKREQNPTPERTALEGKLLVSITKVSEKARRSAPVSDAGTVPVRAGDVMYLEAKYKEPAHTFLVWLDATGKIVPLYPW